MRALTIWRDLVREQPDRPEYKAELASSLNHFGNALQVQGANRFDEAVAAYEEAKTIYQALNLVFPNVKANADELKGIEFNIQKLAGKRKSN